MYNTFLRNPNEFLKRHNPFLSNEEYYSIRETVSYEEMLKEQKTASS